MIKKNYLEEHSLNFVPEGSALVWICASIFLTRLLCMQEEKITRQAVHSTNQVNTKQKKPGLGTEIWIVIWNSLCFGSFYQVHHRPFAWFCNIKHANSSCIKKTKDNSIHILQLSTCIYWHEVAITCLGFWRVEF